MSATHRLSPPGKGAPKAADRSPLETGSFLKPGTRPERSRVRRADIPRAGVDSSVLMAAVRGTAMELPGWTVVGDSTFALGIVFPAPFNGRLPIYPPFAASSARSTRGRVAAPSYSSGRTQLFKERGGYCGSYEKSSPHRISPLFAGAVDNSVHRL